ncbi:MAG TPA: class I SAM-dependent methyltransferase [Candidatus Babeliales bacterium]|nr:class I SAM-dependent methyltransferase [Candidatus Babeliales bacterium]
MNKDELTKVQDFKPKVSWQELQKRKLQNMAETIPHYKDVGGINLSIHPNVYPPGTDTNLLMKTVRIKKGQTALDLCTGTGAIACKLALGGAKMVLGIDLNPRAIINADENKQKLKLTNLHFREGNMFEGITNKFDVITINPPYTNKSASNDIDICFFDKDNTLVKTFFSKLRTHLQPGGIAYIAWSNIGDMHILPKLAKENALKIGLVSQDIGGRGYAFYVYSLAPGL